MAQTRRRRRRKHRGTQGGRVDRGRRRGGRPSNRQEAKAQAKRRAESRRDRGPSWGSSFLRGLVGAAIFFVLMVAAFARPVGAGLALSVVMLGLYVPLGYYVDRFFWRRRQAAKRG
jgi:hypothetical protein